MGEHAEHRRRRLTASFDAHAPDLYRFARRLTSTADDALDLVQETFLRAAQSFDHLPSGASDERAWLVRVLLNIRKDQWRKQAVRQRFAQSAVRTATPVHDPEPAYIDRTTVWRALDCLPPRRRAIVTLFELDGMRVTEIAALLGITAVTVRWHLSRGRKQLARFIAGDAHERTHAGVEERRPTPPGTVVP